MEFEESHITTEEMLKLMNEEIETYKKALEMACDDISCVRPGTFCRNCPIASDDDMCLKNEVKQDYYLQKAREE